MNSENLLKYISPFIVLSFILAVTSDYCLPDQYLPGKEHSYITNQEASFNPFCQIKSFSPEPPETENPFQPIPTSLTSNIVASGTSIYPSPSPSFPEFEET